LRVEALATPAEDRVSVWRKAAGEPFFSLHFASDATPGDGPAGREGLDLIRPDDDIRIDAPETMTTIELIASARHPDDGQDPRRGFGVDRRSRVSLPTGNGEPQQAGAVIRDAALRESFIASLAARMAPYRGRLAHDPMAAFLAADRLLEAGVWGKSVVNMLERAMAGGVEPFWVLHRLALTYLGRGELYPNAAETIRMALDRNPDGLGVFDALAKSLVARGMYAEALATADGVLLRDQSSINALYFRSVCRHRFGADDPEVGALAQPDSPPEHLALWAAVMRRHQQTPDVVLPPLQAAIESGRASFEVFVAAAAAQEAAGRHAQAIVMVAEALEQAPDLADAVKVADAFAAENQKVIARLLYDGVRSRAPWMREVVLPWAKLAIADQDIGPHVRAAVDDIAANGPDRIGAQLVKASLSLADGDPKSAVRTVGSLADQAAPSDILSLADYAVRQNQREVAIEIAALGRSRSRELAVFWVEQSIHALRPHTEIEAGLRIAEDAGADPAWAAMQRILMAVEGGDMTAAVGNVTSIVKSENAGLGVIDLARKLASDGNQPAAVALAQAAAQAVPQSDRLQIAAATLMIDHGALDDHLRDMLDRVVARTSDVMPALLQRFRFSLASGDAADAAHDLRRVEEEGGDAEPLYRALEHYHGQPILDAVMRLRHDDTDDETDEDESLREGMER
jgi:tetratricopeptide (TPR) repeat protein